METPTNLEIVDEPRMLPTWNLRNRMLKYLLGSR